jgi:uridine nucleosidase
LECGLLTFVGDPEAAKSMFSNLVLATKTTIIALNLADLCLATAAARGKLLKGGNPSKAPSDLQVMIEVILAFFASGYHNFFGIADGLCRGDQKMIRILEKFK